MAKGVKDTVRTFLHNLGIHAKWVLTGKEKAGHALKGVTKDSRKLSQSVAGSLKGHDHDRAVVYVKQGRRAYNDRRYTVAEEEFREAIITDPSYALAHTLLGHTLYQLGRPKEAATYWERAIEIDPKSEAADKARRKLAMLENQMSPVRQWMKEHDRDT